jgi:hypothetical protein
MKALRPKMWALLVLVLGGAGAFAATQGAPAEAADHLDPPARVCSSATCMATDDRASDIADVFAWTRGTGATESLVLAMSFDGPNPPAMIHGVPCDRDVLYQLHIDNDSDANFDDEYRLDVRFGHDDGGTNCYIQGELVAVGTGTVTTVSGPVETNLVRPLGASATISLFAGVRDDAFFFDLQGFRDVLHNGRLIDPAGTMAHPLYLHNDRDFFAGLNTPAIVVELPVGAVINTTTPGPLRVWGSTARYH